MDTIWKIGSVTRGSDQSMPRSEVAFRTCSAGTGSGVHIGVHMHTYIVCARSKGNDYGASEDKRGRAEGFHG